MLTKDSMRPSLKETVESVFANVPVNRLIVVDGGSVDGTREFLAKRPKVLLVDDPAGNKATSRQKGMELVETEVFAFIDSDIVLQRNWFTEALPLLGRGVGAVSTYPRYFGSADLVQRGLEKMYRRRTRRRFDTAAALVRTEAVRGIRIPAEFVMSEDEFMGRAMEGKGYPVICVGNPVAYHRESPSRVDMVAKGRLMRKNGWWSTRYLARQFFLSTIEGLFILFYTRSLPAAWQRVRNSGMVLLGYLEAAKG